MPPEGCQESMIGGQAVLEGVMMRGPLAVSVAVRRPGGQIVVRRDPIRPLPRKLAWLRWPGLRGGLALFSSLKYGIQALNYSAEVAMEDAGPTGPADPAGGPTAGAPGEARGPSPAASSGAGRWTVWGTMLLALAASVLVFLVAPLALTELARSRFPELLSGSLAFNLLDGLIRLVFFLAYIGAISLLADIRRFFQYHGAEHKVIFAHEAGEPLVLEKVRRWGTLHPRCGTSFLLLVMVVAILVFSLIPRIYPFWAKASLRLILLPLIAGVSFELARAAAGPRAGWLIKALVAPGLWLQRITTREPDDGMLEVAIAALQGVLSEEEGEPPPAAAPAVPGAAGAGSET